MKDLKWNDAKLIEPSNRDWCIVELENGDYGLAYQYFGCWPDGMKVKRWIFADFDLLSKLVNSYFKGK